MDLGGLDWPSLRLDLAARLSVADRKDSLFLSGRGGNHIRPGMTPIFHVQVGSEPELDSRKSHPAPSAEFPAGSIELSSASAVGNTSLIMRNEQDGKHQGRIARTPLDGRIPYPTNICVDETLFFFSSGREPSPT